MSNTSSLTSKIINLAVSAGFDACGIVPARIDTTHKQYFKDWIGRGYNSEMNYLERNDSLRWNASELVPNAKSVIVLLASYHRRVTPSKKSLKIAKYARSIDYHKAMKTQMCKMLDSMQEYDSITGRCFVDSAPVPERSFATRAGLGFIGKNTCLINETYGSWFFIGEIIIDKELEYNNETQESQCSNCQLCIDACPTGALSGNGLNANKCISYHTIENKNKIPSEVSKSITNQFFGCDICQDVCPFNKDVLYGTLSSLNSLPLMLNLKAENVNALDNISFKKMFKHTPLYRTGIEKLKENLTYIKTKTT